MELDFLQQIPLCEIEKNIAFQLPLIKGFFHKRIGAPCEYEIREVINTPETLSKADKEAYVQFPIRIKGKDILFVTVSTGKKHLSKKEQDILRLSFQFAFELWLSQENQRLLQWPWLYRIEITPSFLEHKIKGYLSLDTHNYMVGISWGLIDKDPVNRVLEDIARNTPVFLDERQAYILLKEKDLSSLIEELRKGIIIRPSVVLGMINIADIITIHQKKKSSVLRPEEMVRAILFAIEKDMTLYPQSNFSSYLKKKGGHRKWDSIIMPIKESKSFAIFAIRPEMDDVQEEENKGSINHYKAITRLAQEIVYAIKNREDSPHIVIDESVIFVVFKEKDLSWYIEIAEALSDKTWNSWKNGIRIGVSVWPMYNFHKREAIKNSLKALEHARLLRDKKWALFDETSLHVSGDQYYEQGELEKAIKEYIDALKINPEAHDIRNSLAVCYAQLGMREESYKEFQYIARKSHDYMAHYNLGLMKFADGKLKEAYRELELAAQFATDDIPSLWIELGKLALQLSKYKLAYQYLGKALKLGGKNSNLYRLIAQALYKLKKKKEAKRFLQRAIRDNPFDARSLSLLGMIYLEGGKDLDLAESLCKRAVEYRPDDPELRFNLGRVLKAKERLSPALREFKACLNLGMKQASVYIEIGHIYALQGKVHLAAKAYEEALKINTRDKDTDNRLNSMKYMNYSLSILSP